VLVLQTMRSHDQWNTTIYSNDDRYRGVRNIREMVLMNRKDMRERGLEEGDLVDIARRRAMAANGRSTPFARSGTTCHGERGRLRRSSTC
jgi:anaerobic selenocysteine-containing dehydrogenase